MHHTRDIPLEELLHSGNDFELRSEHTQYEQHVTEPKFGIKRETLSLLGIEVLSRIAFWSTVVILPQFSIQLLEFSETEVITMSGLLWAWAYICSILSAVVTDSYWGRSKMIQVLLVVHFMGFLLINSSSYFFGVKKEVGIVVLVAGITCVGLGRGGLDANMTPFLADQIPNITEECLSMLCRMFYLCSCIGALLSFILIPLISIWVDYWVCFMVSTVLSFLGLLTFFIECNHYANYLPKGNVVMSCFQIVKTAIYNKVTSKTSGLDALAIQPRDWLDWAKIEHDPEVVDGLRDVFQIIFIFVPFPVYWAILLQTMDLWVKQADEMDLSILKPTGMTASQTSLFHYVAAILTIPVLNLIIFPLLKKGNYSVRPAFRIFIGLGAATSAILGSLLLQVLINGKIPKSVTILDQLPLYQLSGVSTIFILATSMELAYSESPPSLRGIVTALCTLSPAFGRLIVLAISPTMEALDRTVALGICFALMTVFSVVIYLLLRQYRYRREVHEPELFMSHAWTSKGLVFYGSDSEQSEDHHNNSRDNSDDT